MIPSVNGLAKLARMSFDNEDMAPLWEQLTARFSGDQTDADARQTMYAALMDMCLIDQMQNNPERGLQFQAQALEECRLYQIPPAVQPPNSHSAWICHGGKDQCQFPHRVFDRKHRNYAVPAVYCPRQAPAAHPGYTTLRLFWSPKASRRSPCFSNWSG